MLDAVRIDYVIGDAERLSKLAQVPLSQPFSEAAIALAQSVSAALLVQQAVRRHPELVALAFWLRKANISRMAAKWRERSDDDYVRLPRGTVFHIAPANVDTIFVYSWFLSLLAGNRNIMRMSGRRSPPLALLEHTIAQVLADAQHANIAAATVIMRYDRSDGITADLSARCDTRIIWGGDSTVDTIRQLPLKPAANEAVFPNRHGIALIDAAAFVAAAPDVQVEVARLFALDSFVFGQAACSSPRALYWLGSGAADAAAARFWPLVFSEAREIDHGIDPATLMRKRIASDRLAIAGAAESIDDHAPLQVRVGMDAGVAARQLHDGAELTGGLFIETAIDDVGPMLQTLTARTQTLVYWGVARAALRDALLLSVAEGPLRIVPLGSALAFSNQWDGHDFFDILMRKIPVL